MAPEWTRAELLQLFGIIASLGSALILVVGGYLLHRQGEQIHVMINSRMGQMIAGAHAEGQVKERADADARIAGSPADPHNREFLSERVVAGVTGMTGPTGPPLKP